jgi:hypothetical protein
MALPTGASVTTDKLAASQQVYYDGAKKPTKRSGKGGKK